MNRCLRAVAFAAITISLTVGAQVARADNGFLDLLDGVPELVSAVSGPVHVSFSTIGDAGDITGPYASALEVSGWDIVRSDAATVAATHDDGRLLALSAFDSASRVSVSSLLCVLSGNPQGDSLPGCNADSTAGAGDDAGGEGPAG